MKTPDYNLSKDQKAFVRKAKKEGFDVDYGYSGRGMYGRRCPAVRLSRSEVGSFGFKGAAADEMGLGIVVYMP